jgi:hypothetical protein
MKIRSIAVAAVALAATSLAFAGEAALKPAQLEPAPRGQTLLEDLAAGMRDVLRAVVPEITLPELDVKLPSLDALTAKR